MKSLSAVRVFERPSLTGSLHEGPWKDAPSVGPFTVQWPTFGTVAQLPTDVKVLYDDDHLYVGARMQHPKGKAKVIQLLHRRDQQSSSDWFTVYVDSMRNQRTALGFWVNASGVQRDTLHAGDGDTSNRGDASWDGVWESRVSVDEDGWTAKLKIPFTLLRFKNGGTPQSWGINFCRADQGPIRETSFWALPPRGQNAFVNYFPELKGIEGVKPRPRREWIPFMSAQRKFETANAFDDRKWTYRAGLDAHLGLGTNAQLDLSIRPDFGQVEVDQAVLNLGTYETYFQEKRPFFLEGMEVFNMPDSTLFYSRRIGAGLREPSLANGEKLVDMPQSLEIDGAAKYTAKLDSGLDIGVLGAGVAHAEATVMDGLGQAKDVSLFPRTHYGVLRLQQSVSDSGSTLGGYAAQMGQSGEKGRESQIQALDGVWRSADRTSIVQMTLARSEAGIKGLTAEGYRFKTFASRHWRSGWSVETDLANVGRDYNPNDIGYLARSDQQRLWTSVGRVWDQQMGAMRNLKVTMSGAVARDQAGAVIERSLGLSTRTDFTNFVSSWAAFTYDFAAEDDRELRTFRDPVKKYLATESRPTIRLGMDTPGNRPWYGRVEGSRTQYDGGPTHTFNLFQILKPTMAMEIQLDTTYTRANGEKRYLHPGVLDAAPMVGLRRMQELDQTLRISYAFTPNFTLQAFSQWMTASWAYRAPQYWTQGGRWQDGLASGVKPEMQAHDRLWNANLIARWEFRPGSTLFVVYSHHVGYAFGALEQGNAAFSPLVELHALRHQPSDDSVQVKLSWMF